MFFSATARREPNTLSLHDALPIFVATKWPNGSIHTNPVRFEYEDGYFWLNTMRGSKWLENFKREGEATLRSEEHTSELQSPCNLVCRLLLEKKKKADGKDIRVTER